jgi:hypothetical protein
VTGGDMYFYHGSSLKNIASRGSNYHSWDFLLHSL